MAVNDPTQTPPPESELEQEQESADVSLEVRIGNLESRLDQLIADFTTHEHPEPESESEPGTPPPTGPSEDERPHAGNFWFRRIGE
jgi:hypothetical protein